MATYEARQEYFRINTCPILFTRDADNPVNCLQKTEAL